MTCANIHSFQADIDDEIPLARLEIDDAFGRVDLHSSRIDEDVDRAQPLDNVTDGRSHLLVFRHVRGNCNSLDLFRRKASGGGFRLVETNVEYRECRPLIGKPPRERASQRAAAAGNNNDLILESEVIHKQAPLHQRSVS